MDFQEYSFNKSGQSLMEILVAVAVGVIMIGAAAVVIVPALKTNVAVNEEKVGSSLGRALFENVRVFSETNWDAFYGLSRGSSSVYYLTSSTPFKAIPGTERIVVSTTTYSRNFYVEDVCRNWAFSYDVADCSDTDSNVAVDPTTLKLVVNYSWEPNNSTDTFASFLTRFKGDLLIETDWSGGFIESRSPVTSSDAIFSTSSNVTSTAGSLILILD